MSRILVVDDERCYREEIGGILIGLGHEVATEASRARALERLKQNQFEIVFTDGHMEEEGSGLQLAADIKGRWPHVQVVYVSSRAGVDRRHLDGILDKRMGIHKRKVRVILELLGVP